MFCLPTELGEASFLAGSGNITERALLDQLAVQLHALPRFGNSFIQKLPKTPTTNCPTYCPSTHNFGVFFRLSLAGQNDQNEYPSLSFFSYWQSLSDSSPLASQSIRIRSCSPLRTHGSRQQHCANSALAIFWAISIFPFFLRAAFKRS